MTAQDYIQIILFVALLIGLTPILGNYMYKVFTGQKHKSYLFPSGIKISTLPLSIDINDSL